jgi:hypothetical protein
MLLTLSKAQIDIIFIRANWSVGAAAKQQKKSGDTRLQLPEFLETLIRVGTARNPKIEMGDALRQLLEEHSVLKLAQRMVCVCSIFRIDGGSTLRTSGPSLSERCLRSI